MYELFHGDCLDYMETAEENSVDSIVTDPPYFMLDKAGKDGIMGKQWDGVTGLWRYIWNNNQFVNIVVNFLKYNQIVLNGEEVFTAPENASTPEEKSNEMSENALYVKRSSQLNDALKNASAHLLVVTKREVLGSLNGLSENQIKTLEKSLSGVSENASFVIPILSQVREPKKSVAENVIKLSKARECREVKIDFTKTEIIKIKDAIVEMVGGLFGSEYTSEINGLVEFAESIVGEKKYNVTILYPTMTEELMKSITLLLYASLAIPISSRIQNDIIQNFFTAVFQEALRLTKPGGHMLAFGGSRTFHRLMCAIEDAGWEIRDTIMWVYGEGFPKSYNVGKGIDKLLKTGNASWNGTGDSSKGALGYSKLQYEQGDRPADYSDRHQTKTEITEEKAMQWKGWGTALKPAFELIVVARKPFKGSIANNTLIHGTGALNIDDCRVETKVSQKRWPANLIHDGSEEVENCFPYKKSGSPNGEGQFYSRSSNTWGAVNINCGGSEEAYRYSDEGSASRFFYCAKASKKDRDEGLEDLELSVALGEGRPSGSSFERRGLPPVLVRNTHPTVKPTKLMRYLCRLVTQPSGIIFDPFMGSGSTGKAAMLEGFSFIGCEKQEEYIEIARRRIEHAIKEKE